MIQTSKEIVVSKTQDGSLRTRIVVKLLELQEKYGTILNTDLQMADGPAKTDYQAWYVEQRTADIGVKHSLEHFRDVWAFVHLRDAVKHRAEQASGLTLEAVPTKAQKEAVPA